MDTQRGHQSLFFDPDGHPEGTLKAFTGVTKQFKSRYNAQDPDVPRVVLDAAIQQWKIEYATADGTESRLTIAKYEICDNWCSKDTVAKFLGMLSSSRMYTDWQIEQPDESIRNNSTWDNFLKTMKKYYKPTENSTSKNFHLRI